MQSSYGQTLLGLILLIWYSRWSLRTDKWFNPCFTRHVITNPCWDLRYSLWVKGSQVSAISNSIVSLRDHCWLWVYGWTITMMITYTVFRSDSRPMITELYHNKIHTDIYFVVITIPFIIVLLWVMRLEWWRNFQEDHYAVTRLYHTSHLFHAYGSGHSIYHTIFTRFVIILYLWS